MHYLIHRSHRRMLALSLLAGMGILVCFIKLGQIGNKPAHFTPVVEQVQMRSIPAYNYGFTGYHVIVYIGYHGRRPLWWGQAEGAMMSQTVTALRGKKGPQMLNPCFLSRSGHRYEWNMCSEAPSLYDPTRQQYYVDMTTEISNDFHVPDSSLVGTIKMGDGSLVKVSAPASQALQSPPGPSIAYPVAVVPTGRVS